MRLRNDPEAVWRLKPEYVTALSPERSRAASIEHVHKNCWTRASMLGGEGNIPCRLWMALHLRCLPPRFRYTKVHGRRLKRWRLLLNSGQPNLVPSQYPVRRNFLPEKQQENRRALALKRIFSRLHLKLAQAQMRGGHR